MKVRIKPTSKGTKGVDWERWYSIQVKTFLIWSKWKEVRTIDEATELINIFNVTEIEYKIF